MRHVQLIFFLREGKNVANYVTETNNYLGFYIFIYIYIYFVFKVQFTSMKSTVSQIVKYYMKCWLYIYDVIPCNLIKSDTTRPKL